MTVFSMRSSASVADTARRTLAAILLTVLCALAHADDAIRYAEIVPSEEGYVVNADIDLDLKPRLVEAVSRGVSLYFTAELVIERPRWYWFDEEIVERRLEFRLSYHAITRSYRLSVGNFHKGFDSLEAALRTMSRIRNWYIVPREELEPGESYQAALRMGLDTSLLPRPFQVTTIGSRDWNLGTDWERWTFVAGARQ